MSDPSPHPVKPSRVLLEQLAKAIYNADPDRAIDSDDKWEWWTAEAIAVIPIIVNAAASAVKYLLIDVELIPGTHGYILAINNAQDAIHALATNLDTNSKQQ